ncbi:MAG: alpha/beta fold hydrolase [Xanthobacteraceae bacterium]
MTRFYDAGEGLPVLLLHGVGMPADVWIRNIPSLAERYRVIAPDLLGCGFTEPGRYREGAAHPYMIDHLITLMDRLDLSRTAVIGSSLGALLALLLHLRQPERIPVLTLVSSGSAFNSDADLKTMYEATWKNGRSAFVDPSRQNCMRRMASIVAPGTEIPEALLFAQMTSYAMPGAIEVFDRRMASLADLDSWRQWRVQPRLPEVTAKVLAIFGGKDPRANVETARENLKAVKGSRLVVFADSRHYPQLDEAERFDGEVLNFLAESYPSGHPATLPHGSGA